MHIISPHFLPAALPCPFKLLLSSSTPLNISRSQKVSFSALSPLSPSLLSLSSPAALLSPRSLGPCAPCVWIWVCLFCFWFSRAFVSRSRFLSTYLGYVDAMFCRRLLGYMCVYVYIYIYIYMYAHMSYNCIV